MHQAVTGSRHLMWEVRHLCEMRLDPEPKLTLLEIMNFLKKKLYPLKFLSSGENLYVIETCGKYLYKDFGKFKWVPFEETRDEYTFFY